MKQKQEIRIDKKRKQLTSSAGRLTFFAERAEGVRVPGVAGVLRTEAAPEEEESKRKKKKK